MFDATVQPVTDSPVEQPVADTKLAIVADANGSRRVARVPVEKVAEKPASPEPAKEPEKADPEAAPQAPVKEQPVEYTAEELGNVNSENIDTFDLTRVPEVSRNQFKALQAAFTRDRQKTSALQKQLEELTNSLQDTITKVKEPEVKVTPKEAYARQHAFLRDVVAKDFGMDNFDMPESVNDWPQEMQDAYHDKRIELKRQIEAEQQKQTALAQRKVKFDTNAAEIEKDLRAIDPDACTDLVSKLMNKELPEKVKDAIFAAVEAGDKKAVTEIFNDHRNKFRNVSTAPAPVKMPETPPALETGGQGAEQKPKEGVLDAPFLSKFRSAEPGDKLDMIRKFRRAHNM